MNREKAEKLLAALIFDDLDEASKADLTAYLETDDELRERLADMRMTMKITSDALQQGPEPTLDERRLKRLSRLAEKSSRQPVVFTMRYMVAAAAVLAVIALPALFMPSLSKVSRPASFQTYNAVVSERADFNEDKAYATNISGGTSVVYEDESQPQEATEGIAYVDGDSTGRRIAGQPASARPTDEIGVSNGQFAIASESEGKYGGRGGNYGGDSYGTKGNSYFARGATVAGKDMDADGNADMDSGVKVSLPTTVQRFENSYSFSYNEPVDGMTRGREVAKTDSDSRVYFADGHVVNGLVSEDGVNDSIRAFGSGVREGAELTVGHESRRVTDMGSRAPEVRREPPPAPSRPRPTITNADTPVGTPVAKKPAAESQPYDAHWTYSEGPREHAVVKGSETEGGKSAQRQELGEKDAVGGERFQSGAVAVRNGVISGDELALGARQDSSVKADRFEGTESPQTPILGDLPLVGRLYRSKDNKRLADEEQDSQPAPNTQSHGIEPIDLSGNEINHQMANRTSQQAQKSESGYLQQVIKERNRQIDYTRAVVNDSLEKAQKSLESEKYENSREALRRAYSVVEKNQRLLGDDHYDEYTAQLKELEQKVNTAQHVAYEKYDVRTREVATEEMGREIRMQMEKQRAEAVKNYMDRASAFEGEQRYGEALGQLEQLLAVDPYNQEALTKKQSLEHTVNYIEQRKIQKEMDQEEIKSLMGIQRKLVPFAEEMNFPRNWKEISERREKGLKDAASPKDMAVNELLDQTVDLSSLTEDSTMEEAMDIVRNSVTPALPMVVYWPDLRENASVEKGTKIGLDGSKLRNVALRTALARILETAGAGDAAVDYIVQEGTITVATADALPTNFKTKIYEMADLFHPPSDVMGGGGNYMARRRASEIMRLIQQTIEPDTWFNEGGEGRIDQYSESKLVIYQSPEVHEQIDKLLEKTKESLSDDVETPVREDVSDLPSASHFKSVPVNPWVMTEHDALSTFGLDVDTASYTLCRRYINGGFLPPAGAVRMEEFINYFNYHYPQQADRTFTVHAEAAPSPFSGKGKNLTLLKVGVKARTIGRDQRKAAHLIFVVDTSASMGRPDRLPLVQQALNLLIDRLSDADRVTLITCANESRLHLEATPVSQRGRIRQAINAIQPSGSTNLLAGLQLGYGIARRSFDPKQINHIVLCTDGVANVGQTEAQAVLNAVAADRKQGITITCVGVGYGSYNDAFLESLANQGDGSYVFLDSTRQAQRVFVEQLAATMHVVAKDARIQVSFNPDRVRRYRLIGYENRDIKDKRFRDDTVDAGEVGSGQCSTALYELELTNQQSADQQGELGTVFVRYRRADTGRIEEISHSLKSAIVQRRKIEDSPGFFLAAVSSRFAEILRQSEHARDGSLTDVLAVAEKVSRVLPLDRDVRELIELIRKAEHLPRAQ